MNVLFSALGIPPPLPGHTFCLLSALFSWFPFSVRAEPGVQKGFLACNTALFSPQFSPQTSPFSQQTGCPPKYRPHFKLGGGFLRETHCQGTSLRTTLPPPFDGSAAYLTLRCFDTLRPGNFTFTTFFLVFYPFFRRQDSCLRRTAY